MNRLDFLKEMKSGFLKTIGSIYEPILEEDVDSVMNATDKMLGITWHFICTDWDSTKKIEQKYVEGKPIIVIQREQKQIAYSGICGNCSHLIHVSTLQSTCKCYHCENEASLLIEADQNHSFLHELPLKKKEDGYYVGLK